MQVLDAQFLASADREAALPAPAFTEVAFAGRSNVGKSSLINRLTGRRKLVRTSQTPGCTRGLALFRVRLRLPKTHAPEPGEEAVPGADEAHLDLIDLPGYGYAKRSKSERRSWGPMIEGFLEHRAGLRAVVVIVDVRRGPENDDLQLIEYLDHLGITSIVVATKTDKLPANQRKPALGKLKPRLGRVPLGFSSATGDGSERLWGRILKATHIGG